MDGPALYLLPKLATSALEPASPRRPTQESPRVGVAVNPESMLIAQAREGDRGARTELCRIHQGTLFALLYRLVGHRQDAEDLTQDALVRALRSLHTFRGEADFSTWLRRIAIHLVHDRNRKRGRRGRPVSLDAASGAEEPGEGAPESLQRAELEQHLKNLVLALPPHLRVPLILRLEEKRTYDEIAALTGVQAATCRTQIMKAREFIRRGLQQTEEGQR